MGSSLRFSYFFLWMAAFGFFACQQNNLPRKDSFGTLSTTSLLEVVRNGVSESELRSFRVALLVKSEIRSEHDSLEMILANLEEQYPDNYYYRWVVESVRAAILMEQGDVKPAFTLVAKAKEYIGKHDSIIASDVYHNIGYAYMNLGGADDSVLYYWRKAYQLTEENQDIQRLTVTSFNLAAHYHNLGLHELARRLFARTIHAMEQLGKKSPLLMNNIVSTMIARERYKEADEYWRAHETELVGDTSTYAGQVILLNRAVLSQRLGRFTETDSILGVLKHATIQPLLWRDYIQTLLVQAVRLNLDTLSDSRFHDQVVKNVDFLIHNQQTTMHQWMQQDNWSFLRDSIPTVYAKLKHKKGYDMRYLASLSRYLAEHASKGTESVQYYHEMLQYQDSVDVLKLKADLLATNELSEYESLMKQLALNKVALETSQKREVNYIVILVLVMLLVVLIFISLKEKLHISKERAIWLEKEKSQAEEIVLSNQRLITYSKVVLERNNQIKQRLMQLNLKGRSAVVLELKEIIKELDTLNRVSTEEKPQVADDLIEKQMPEAHPHLSLLTKVEQRIYVLVQSNYRPKDIANMLGYSVQYVRNVKSRIRKKLSLDDSWD